MRALTLALAVVALGLAAPRAEAGDAGDPADRSRVIAVDMRSGGWLGRTPIKQAYGEDGAPSFVRGRDHYVVAANGGRARRLARGVSGPSWARR